MKCVEPGCTGVYEDAYCTICGSPQPRETPPAPTPAAPGRVDRGSATSPAGAPHDASGDADGSGDGDGDGDGDHDDGSGHGGHADDHDESAALNSGALAVGTDRPAQLTPAPNARGGRGGLGATQLRAAAARRRVRANRRSEGSRLGMGLTHVPPVAPVDPATAVLEHPEVPQERRVCPNCGAPVGRTKGAGSAAGATDTAGAAEGPAKGKPSRVGAAASRGRTQGFCPQCRAPYSFTPKLQPGDLVAGQYEVAGAIAHGGMGWIYLARDQNVSHRWVVLKGLLNTGDADALAAAVAEQQVLAQVEHPLIVEIYNVVTHEGSAYTVMEYVGGVSLKQMLKQRLVAKGAYDPFPVAQALAYVLEILPAFTYLHELGFIYCDFKPDNLIQVGDAVKLIDLGGVRRADDNESPIYGTVGYQAPEVPEVGPSVASDIYTIGRTLAVLTFEFRGYQSQYATSLPPSSQVPPFTRHDAFYRLVAKACAEDPDDRFLTVEELRVQMLGVLRQVVFAGDDGADAGTARPAAQSAHSQFFEPPAVVAEALTWRQLPTLKPDDHDPMVDWVSMVAAREPLSRYQELAVAPQFTPEVWLEQARCGLAAGRPDLVAKATSSMLKADPWDWRAAWMLGLDALARQEADAAQGYFGAVRDQVPGEIAPRLALALAAELAGQAVLAEREYLTCLRTDAEYVAPAAFGIARARVARGDVNGAISVLDAVPPSSRAHPQARWVRAGLMNQRGTLTDLADAIGDVGGVAMDPRQRLAFDIGVYDRALRHVVNNGDASRIRIGEVPATSLALRTALERSYRELAELTPEASERFALVDRANAVRPWSLT